METKGESQGDAGEPAASLDEVRDAVHSLSDPDHRRLEKAAYLFFRFHPALWDLYEPKDLLINAVHSALSGERKWPKKRVDIAKFLVEAMRSIAWNDARKLRDGTLPRFVSEQDLQVVDEDGNRSSSPLEDLGEKSPSVEEEMLDKEHKAKGQANLALVRVQLAVDPDVLKIFDLYLQGLSKRVVRRRLGMTDGQFWSADRQLNRRIEQILKHLEDNET